MKRILIKQAIFLPVIYFGFILLAGLFADDYSHFGQHASELGINSDNTAAVLFRIGIIVTSFSLIALASGLAPSDYRGLTQRVFGLVVFGWVSYVSFHLNSYLGRTGR